MKVHGILPLVAYFLVTAKCQDDPALVLTPNTARLFQRYKIAVMERFPKNDSYVDIQFRHDKEEKGQQPETEVEINRNIRQHLLEGDIIPTEVLLKDLISGLDPGKRRRKRKMSAKKHHLWETKHIAYTFDLPPQFAPRSYISDYETRRVIRDGLAEISSQTCISFYEQSYFSEKEDGIFFYSGPGCFATLGHQGGFQPVSIGLRCLKATIVAHEVFHTLGIWHEQSRPDRDSYVYMNYNAILPGREFNFERRSYSEIDHFGLAYDFGSAMHYGPKEFVKNYANPSMESYDRNFQRTFGQREDLSFIDIKTVNTAYCKDVCRNKLPCKNGGYTDPKNCYACRCPAGLGGTYCDRAARSSKLHTNGGLTRDEN